MNAHADSAGHAELATLVALLRERHGAGLRSLILFGSCLSPALRKPGSIPDLFALVDSLPAALAHEACGPVASLAARVLPPTTLALRVQGHAQTVAKLNLIETSAAGVVVREAPDLYLAGRLGKHTRLLWARDEASAREVVDLLSAAAERIVDSVLDGLTFPCTLEHAIQRCVAISYDAELRPESAARVARAYHAFAAEYDARYRPLLIARALARGLAFDATTTTLLDRRPPATARRERSRAHRLIARSRLRSALRWPKQAVVYRGWFPYLLGKLRRARSA